MGNLPQMCTSLQPAGSHLHHCHLIRYGGDGGREGGGREREERKRERESERERGGEGVRGVEGNLERRGEGAYKFACKVKVRASLLEIGTFS